MNDSYLSSVSMSGLLKYIERKYHHDIWLELDMSARTYARHQIIYAQDDVVTRAAIVHSGIVKGERLRVEGGSELAYMYRRGDIFAFEGAVSGKKTSPLQLTAEENSEIIFFDPKKIFYSRFERSLIIGLMELLANDDIKKLYRIDILSRRGLRERIMAYFRVLASKSGSDTFTLDMSREQLADYLCVNRSALSYELNRMKREGVIDFDKRRVTLRNL